MGKLERIIIETDTQETSHQKRFELVERKGICHPDYLADAIAERFSRLLCKEYLQRCGQVLHHNVDKLIITAGQTKTVFGGGRFERPVLVFFSGRATSSFGNRFFDVNKIARKSAVEVIEETFSGTMGEQWRMQPTWNPRDRHEMVPLVKTRGGKLLFQKSLLSFPSLANDSSCGSGYAPMSWSERLVYEAERFLNSAEFKKKHSSSGTDIKITGTRTGKMLSMTIAMAFVDRFVAGVREYIEQKARITEELREHIIDHLPSSGESIGRIDLNPFDNERVALKTERGNGNARALTLEYTNQHHSSMR
jgi:S-adenosylmethionine synthetase